jgi:myosin heavy subunit
MGDEGFLTFLQILQIKQFKPQEIPAMIEEFQLKMGRELMDVDTLDDLRHRVPHMTTEQVVLELRNMFYSSYEPSVVDDEKSFSIIQDSFQVPFIDASAIETPKKCSHCSELQDSFKSQEDFYSHILSERDEQVNKTSLEINKLKTVLSNKEHEISLIHDTQNTLSASLVAKDEQIKQQQNTIANLKQSLKSLEESESHLLESIKEKQAQLEKATTECKTLKETIKKLQQDSIYVATSLVELRQIVDDTKESIHDKQQKIIDLINRAQAEQTDDSDSTFVNSLVGQLCEQVSTLEENNV